jgi:RimJ/RimL family protein N-acetyltransferase
LPDILIHRTRPGKNNSHRIPKRCHRILGELLEAGTPPENPMANDEKHIDLEPITLEGKSVRLIPIRREHWQPLWEVAKDSTEYIFSWIPYPMRSAEDFQLWADKALAEQARHESIVLVTVERSSGRVIGSTRFMNIDPANRRVEIGSTWIATAWQRTAINTEAKYLMLLHAFEQWGCIRVELKTDALNQKSRNAILRIGAKEEGTLRKHLVTHTGRIRDSVYFSILDTEWPEVKASLEARLKNRATR